MKKQQDKGVLTGDICPICSQTMGQSVGPEFSTALIVTDLPEYTSVGLSYPLQILRAELSRVGVDLYSLRITSLAKHPMADKKDNECRNEHSKMLWKELENARLIFALGGEIVKLLTGKTSQAMSGILTNSDMTKAEIVCSMDPAVAWHGMVGEVRLACQVFAKRYLELEDW